MKIKRLGSTEVMHFGYLKEKLKDIKTECESASDKLKTLIKKSYQVETKKSKNKGEISTTKNYYPAEGRFALQFCAYSVPDINWREEFEKLYRTQYGKNWKKNYRKFLASAKRAKRESLTVIPNKKGK